MDADGDEEDGDESEVDYAVDENGDGAGLQVSELHNSSTSGKLEKEPGSQKNEQRHGNDNRPPVAHFAAFLISLSL